MLLKMGFEGHRIFVVGTTALDNIEIDESRCPNEPYNLVLLHPDSVSEDATYKALRETIHNIRLLKEPNVVWLEPNNDPHSNIIRFFLHSVSYASELLPYVKHFTIWENLPRSQYLGLLRKCSRAIGNSSSFVYELPLLNPDCELIQIGERNKHRTPPSTKRGGSAEIAETLLQIPIDDFLRRKRLCL
jgi:UDP-N-acetylglucosamine 2-epimerase